MTIRLSLFEDVAAKRANEVVDDLKGLVETICETTAPTKEALPLLKFARFGKNADPKSGSLRTDHNLIACSGVEGDYDAGIVPFDEVVERLIKANISAIIYTTGSHTREKPRWRVLAPFSVELPPSDRAHMVDRLNGALGGILARESWTLSQSYFFGRVEGVEEFRIEIVDGEPIDLLDELDLIAVGKPNGAVGGNGTKPNGHDRAAGGFVDEEALAEAIRTGADYHVACTRILGKWARNGISFMDAQARMLALFDQVDDALRDKRWAERRADVPRTVDSIYGKEARKEDTADAEFSAIQIAIKSLEPGDSVSSIIERIAAAKLKPTVESQLLEKIKNKGVCRIGDLREELQFAKKKIASQSRSINRQAIPWSTLVRRYEDTSEIRPMMANVAIVLRNAQEFRDALWHSDFANIVMVRRPLPWDNANNFIERQWTDTDELKLTEWMQSSDDFINVPPHIVYQGVAAVASERHYHPVREYLDGVVWDKKKRIDRLLLDHFGCNVEDAVYLTAISARAMIQAVARIYKPGIKADCCLLLDGEQGIKKSTALRLLFDPLELGWFTDEIEDLGNKDAKLQLRGKWCIEFGELHGLRKSDFRKAKAFLSCTVDCFRPPYGRQTIDVPRQCVFVGTSNDDENLVDTTGNRRYWPAWCISINVDKIWEDRHQLWAEAVHRYHAGEKWWIDKDKEPELYKAAVAAQAERLESDAWDSEVAEWLGRLSDKKKSEGITTGDVLSGALCINERDKWTRAAQTRAGECLRRLGWRATKNPQRRDGDRVRVYHQNDIG